MIDNRVVYLYKVLPKVLQQQLCEEVFGFFFLVWFVFSGDNVFLIMLTAAGNQLLKQPIGFHLNFQVSPSCIFPAHRASAQWVGGCGGWSSRERVNELTLLTDNDYRESNE